MTTKNFQVKKLMKNTKLYITKGQVDMMGLSSIYNDHLEKVKQMKKNKTIAHMDTTMKGCAIGLLTYIGVQQGWSSGLIAGLVPVASLVLSFVSSKIGDKNTTMLLKLATDAIAKKDK